MSSLRDLNVKVDIQDGATSPLNSINGLINQIVNNLNRMGNSSTSNMSGFRNMNSEVSRLTRNLNDSTREITSLNRRLTASENEMRNLRNESQRTERELRDVRTELTTITQRLTQAEQEAQQLRQQMQQMQQSTRGLNQGVGTVNSSFRSLKQTVIGVGTAIGVVGAAQKAIGMVKSSVDGAIKRVDTLAGFPVIMEKMGFSAELAESSINKLSDGIQGLPTTLDGIVGSTQSLSLMTGDLDKATDTALALNNAFIASGSDSNDAARGLDQYTKMLSKNKVESDSWSTLQETMGYALNKTAESFGFAGKSAQNDLYNALKKGKLKFEDFNERIIELSGGVGGFAEIAKDGSAGIGTSFANMKTAVTRGTAGIIQSVQGLLADTSFGSIENVIGMIGKNFNKGLGYISDGIKSIDGEKLGAQLTSGFDKVKSVAIPTFAALKTGIGWLVENKEPVIAVVTGLTAGFAAFKTISTGIKIFETIKDIGGIAGMLTNPIGQAVLLIGGLAAAGVYLYRNWDTVMEKLDTLKSNFSGAWQQIKDNTSNAIQPIIGFFDNMKQRAFGLWETIKQNPMLLSVVGPIGMVVGAGMTLYQNWDNIKAKAVELWTTVTGKFASIKQSVSDFVQPAINWFDNLTGKWNDFKSAISNFKMPEWVTTAGSMVSSAVGKVKGLVDGSHATGLANVPFDGYKAELHKGESVLTADQSNNLRSAGILSGNGNGTPNLDFSGLPKVIDGGQTTAPTAVTTNNESYSNETDGSSISVPVHLSIAIHATGEKVERIKNRLSELEPIVRQIVSNMLDEELQTQ